VVWLPDELIFQPVLTKAGYAVQKDREKFFKLDRVSLQVIQTRIPIANLFIQVFKVYWPEPTVSNTTVSGVVQGEHEDLFAKIRWFVIIKSQDNNFSSCF
jgi:hypothetical protein